MVLLTGVSGKHKDSWYPVQCWGLPCVVCDQLRSTAAKVTYRALSESVIRFVPTQHMQDGTVPYGTGAPGLGTSPFP